MRCSAHRKLGEESGWQNFDLRHVLGHVQVFDNTTTALVMAEHEHYLQTYQSRSNALSRIRRSTNRKSPSVEVEEIVESEALKDERNDLAAESLVSLRQLAASGFVEECVMDEEDDVEHALMRVSSSNS